MAIYNFIYKDVKHKKLLHFIAWFQNNYQLRDWEILLQVSDKVPKEFKNLAEKNPGGCWPIFDIMIAKIWVGPVFCKELNVHPLEVLCHEMLHVLFADSEIESHNENILVNRLQGTILEKYTEDCGVLLVKGYPEWE